MEIVIFEPSRTVTENIALEGSGFEIRDFLIQRVQNVFNISPET
jgi:hypothetical protein